MKQLRLHIYIVLGFFLVTFILGSFFDEAVSQAIYSNKNTFGLIISVIGTLPGYGMFALMGGGFLALGLRKDAKVWLKVLFIILGVGLTLLGVYFSGREFFGDNGFYWLGVPTFVGYFIALPVMGGLGFLGYWIVFKSNKEFLWLLFTILAVAVFMSLVPGVTMLKSIFHRPRFRSLGGEVEFHSWWEPCTNYKLLMEHTGLANEEFKSFPSGHAGAAAVFMFASLIPLIDEKYQKLQLPIFYGGLAWVLLVAFARILVGAHFLSDVSMGAILTLICLLIANEVLIHLKQFKEVKEDSIEK